MSDLSQRLCKPCTGSTPRLGAAEVARLLAELPHWARAEDEEAIERRFQVKNFQAALDLVNQIGRLAEAEGHHPDLHLTGYNHLRVVLATHAIGGLSENDFILAAKIDRLGR